MKDDLTNLKNIVDEAREWMADPVRRQRMHHPVCTVHKPSAQCSCGVHKASSGLAMVSHDLGVLARRLADDDVPVTEEWLRSIGFDSADSFAHDRYPVRVHLIPNQTPSATIVGGHSVECPTRGDVIRLCVALGVSKSNEK